MTAIEQIQAIPFDKITNEGLREEITSYLKEYNQAQDKDDFLKANTENTDTLLNLIKELQPRLLIDPEDPCFDLIKQQSTPVNQKMAAKKTAAKKSPTPKKKAADKKPEPKSKQPSKKMSSAEYQAQIKDLKTQLAACRRGEKKTVKNKVRKQPPKVSKEVYEKTSNRLLSIINLIPEHIRKDQEKMLGIRKTILSLHRKLSKTYAIDTQMVKDEKLRLTQRFEKIMPDPNNK